MHQDYKDILRIAIPSIITNITVPLLGLVSVGIVGHLGNTAYIGSIAIATMLFNMLYWGFNFLRMGTSGIVAQALGRNDEKECAKALQRALIVSFAIGVTLIALQAPILDIAWRLIDASEEVKHYALLYFKIRIWGAPAVMALYSFHGWFVGMQNTRLPMVIVIVQNIVNILVSLVLVFVYDMHVEGVAWGALASQYTGFFMFLFGCRKLLPADFRWWNMGQVFQRTAMFQFFTVNRDIFLRTLFIIAVTTYFTSAGARYGDLTLAVNALLMEFFAIYSYFMDGLAHAGEAIAGKYYGAKQTDRVREIVRKIVVFGGGASGLATLVFLFGGQSLLHLLTNQAEVIAASSTYYFWVLFIPLAGMLGFLYDGICIGITATRLMLYGIMAASLAFFSFYFSLQSTYANHALWGAFIAYLVVRGIFTSYLTHRFLRRL